jgi:hypothetical protein
MGGLPRSGWAFRTTRRRYDGRQHVRELHARGVKFAKIWVDDREARFPS